MDKKEIHAVVRENYAEIARTGSSCCGPSRCGTGEPMGYSREELETIPRGADLGLGCGNPVALASLKEGDVVLDLGSGGGLDCLLASKQVGDTGKVIGVDMTPEMFDRARHNAEEGGYWNVEFRLGAIEHLPVADQSVDAIISNCVINLSPDKEQVFKEAHRTLRPGGRLMVSDIVLLRELPDRVQQSVQAYVACVAGAATKEQYLGALSAAGFQAIEVVQETTVPLDLPADDPTTESGMEMSAGDLRGVVESIRSIQVSAVKPTEH